MVRKILRWVNYFLVACVVILALMVFFKLFRTGGEVPEVAAQEATEHLDKVPKNAFEQKPEAYKDIGSPILTVVLVPPRLELPDLRPYLIYYGINDRPDISSTATVLHFGLKGSDAVASAAPGARLYLKYDNSKRPGAYVFSTDNHETRLWIEADKDSNKANVKVRMLDENGQVITEPAMRASIVLTASTFARLGGGTWEIGKWKVDGTLLARQRARWLGQDLFLNAHGGDEYADFKDKERIEFGEGTDRYSVYVKVGDCLIWDGQRWQAVRLGESSRGFPLLCVTKIDDRVMTLDLWDVGGQGHVTLNLIKSKEAWTPKTLEQDFKFISTRTLSQYVFEVKKERVVLRPYDWLLLTDKAWIPLNSPEQIDDYVERRTQGPLYVFVGPVQKEDKQVLQAMIYSPARTEVDIVDYTLDQPVLGGQFHTESSGSNKKTEEPVKPPVTIDPDLLKVPTENPSEVVTPVTPSEENATSQDQLNQNAGTVEGQTPSGEDQTPSSSDDNSPPADTTPSDDNEGQEGVPQRGSPPELALDLDFDELEHEHENGIRTTTYRFDYSSDQGQIAEVVIPPRTKKRPGHLREDIRFLFQDDAFLMAPPPRSDQD